MTTHRSPLARTASLLVAALALAAPLAACSSDDDEADTSTEATQPSTDDTMADDEMSDDTMADDEMDEMSDDEMSDDEAASGEISTTGVLDFLNEQDPTIGALFDWNVGDGIIAVNYLGAQTVGLYAVEIDEATATSACELASEYALELDDAAVIEVYSGGYSDGVLVVSRTGADGTCAAA